MQLIFCPDLEVDLKSRPPSPAFDGAQVELLLPAPTVSFDCLIVFYLFFCIGVLKSERFLNIMILYSGPHLT